jgi:ribosomal protein S21
VQVLVRDNNVDQALKALKKKMQREGIFRVVIMKSQAKSAPAKRPKPFAARASWPARRRSAKVFCLPASHRLADTQQALKAAQKCIW